MDRAVAKFHRTGSGRMVAFGFNPLEGKFDSSVVAWDDCSGDWKPSVANSAGYQRMQRPELGVPRYVLIEGEDITAICDYGMAYAMRFVGPPLIYEFSMFRAPE